MQIVILHTHEKFGGCILIEGVLHLVIELARSDNMMNHAEATRWARLVGGHLPSLEEIKALGHKGSNSYWLEHTVGDLADYYKPSKQLHRTDAQRNYHFAIAVKLIPLDVGIKRISA